MKSIDEVIVDKKLVAKVIHAEVVSDEVLFFTNPVNTLQVGVQNRKKNIYIKPHTHPPRLEHTRGAKEVIYIIQGRVEVSLYDTNGSCLSICQLKQGDLFIQFTDAHSFRFLEKTNGISLGRYGKANERHRLQVQ